jgi:hypothetical protein
MPTSKLNDVLAKRLETLGQENRLKGAESVICGVIPARNGKGPLYLLEGEGDKAFLRMNSNSYLGMSFRAGVVAAEDEAARKFSRFRRRVAGGKPFEAGREKTGGRKKGSHNVITNDVKEAIVAALIQVGEDGYGHDGLIGYVRGLVLRSDQAGAALLRIVMPLTLNAPASGALGAYKTEEDIRAEFAANGIPFEVIHRLEFHRPPPRFRRRVNNGHQFEAGREKTGGRKRGTPNKRASFTLARRSLRPCRARCR